MKTAIVSASTLFHPGNNPSRRMDSGLGLMLGQMEAGIADPDPRQTLQELFTNPANWNAWLKTLHNKETLAEVEAHIASAFIGRCDSKPARLSAKVRAGIHQIALGLCNQEAAMIETAITKQLAAIQRLRSMAIPDPA